MATPGRPLRLRGGATLERAHLAYETFGDPNAESVVLVCHALTGDAHVTRWGSEAPDGAPKGWWEALVGPGRAVDPAAHFVICSNVLGGCSGSTGPTSVDPATGAPYGPTFPSVAIEDMVEAQSRLLEALGVVRPITVLGGSIGGFQALEWALRFPGRVRGAGVLASGARLSAFGIAFNEIGRGAVRADGRYRDGYYPADDPPTDGLAAARGLAHLTYRSAEAFERRFGRQRRADSGGFEVESYLAHKGAGFVRRFDANTYLGLTRAMDAYDASADEPLDERLRGYGGRLLAVGFGADWLFPSEQSAELVEAARSAGVAARFEHVETAEGHDAFLMPSSRLDAAVRGLLESEGAR
ncbi:MAG: homoserine O-acetyltransferase [Planctomycetota bacterium]